mgnify:CR=1 FL=1|jgi:hypothetical protein|tara:strand:+ start:1122 stop:1859 length:738 start_codon:yes stop_codon:yes gene_type:complete
MAYNFLRLVNEVNRRLNEVELTSSNFSTATGFYAHAKDAVNASLRYINQSEYEWSFNHVEQEDTLSVGVSRYPFPVDSKTIDFDSFRLKENSTLGNDTVKLSTLAYEEYLEKHVEQEYKSDTSGQGVPNRVVHTPSLEYIMTPAPDKAYTVVYEYYRIPVDLELFDDVPAIPERFKHVITDGAMHYAYLFRGNTQDALVAKEKFEEGIKHMRSMIINRYHYVRSYMIPQNTGGGGRIGYARLPLG